MAPDAETAEAAAKAACHSDYVEDAETAKRVQEERAAEKLVELNTAPAHNLPSHDPII